jgi:hypothetical protein
MYIPFNVESAIQVLDTTIDDMSYMSSTNYGIVEKSDLGRRIEAWIVANNFEFELNIWHEAELCRQLLERKK